ncbi:flagellar hook protein FlgE [Phenylobacterium sp.]|jgi:flagellar hook protein FlgE|uniref:flagellar hook protein FlgE n=1 Tax=Phenylobacterium sp. TaxID=1871053 RepID=UPI002F40795B
MSINSAMLAGVSGLVANSSALAAISDNIANVNTVGYKRNQVSFANVVTSQALTGRYSAGGVQGVARQYVGQQGLIQSATSSTDLAISGDGFFVVGGKGAGLTAADSRMFTRAGSFSVDADGYMKNAAGLYLLGWGPPNAAGTFTTSPSDVGTMTAINVKNQGAVVASTTDAAISANLNADQLPSTGAASYLPGTANTHMSAYANGVATGTKPDFTIELGAIDSQGGTRKIVMAFSKPAATGGPPAVVPANEWNAEVYVVPASDVTQANGELMQGKVYFKQDGSIDLSKSTLFGPATTPPAAPSPPEIKLAASGGTAPAWSASAGIAASDIKLDLSQLTQYASASTVTAVSSNGAQVGNVVGVQVDETGIVSVLYDNSQVRQIAQLGLATFANPDGLGTVSGNAYRPTNSSGQYVLKVPGDGGAGKISPSSLEASTVDLSSEFTGLITTQKAYSASSKIITTADQMLDELINIIR